MYFLWLWLKYPLRRERQLSVKLREKDFCWGVSAKRKMTNFGFFFLGVQIKDEFVLYLLIGLRY